MPSADPRSAAAPLVRVRGLSKSFAGARALDRVDLDLQAGQVHGLVGANGAGKSTLIRCLAGLVQPDAGEVEVDGRPVSITAPQHATDLGLAFIHQELNLVPHFDAVGNMLLGRPKATRLGLIDWGRTRRPAQQAADRLGIEFPLDRRVDELSVAQRWLVSIGRALVADSRMIAMDEPTASLSAGETDRLFSIVRDLAASGVAVLYVSHRLDEVLDLCDRVSVFRDGRLTRSLGRGELDRSGLIREIVGRELTPAEPDTASTAAPLRETPVLEARALRRAPAVRDATFTLRRGEVLGLGGLVGAGRTELARLLAGADQPDGGELLLDGAPVAFASVGAAVAAGIGLVPEERRSQGLVLARSVAFNINLADQRPLRRVPWLPLLDPRRARARAAELVQRLGIKTASVDTPVGQLSGGNQQKVLIARWLTRERRVLVLDELSRGVDIGARGEIHAIVRGLARAGTGVLAISSDVEELVALCDRVVVMAEGRVVGELSGSDLTEQAVIALSYASAPVDSEVPA
jgi:ABC-type sugar transport system ATPase subunit